MSILQFVDGVRHLIYLLHILFQKYARCYHVLCLHGAILPCFCSKAQEVAFPWKEPTLSTRRKVCLILNLAFSSHYALGSALIFIF
jgi:hypothetical protein